MPDAGTVVIDPDVLRGLALFKEKHIGLHTVGIENAGGKTQNRMQIILLEQFVPDLLRRIAVGQNAVRKDDADAAAGFHNGHDMLQEVDLIIRGLDELRAVGRDIDTALGAGPKGRIGHDDLVQAVGLIDQGILVDDGALVHADIMEIQIHRREGHDEIGIIRAEKGIVLQETLLLDITALGPHVLIGREKEAARSAAGVYLMVVFDTSSICTHSPEAA